MTRASAQAAIFWLLIGGLIGAVLGGVALGFGMGDDDAALVLVGVIVTAVASLSLTAGLVAKGVELGVTAATPDDY